MTSMGRIAALLNQKGGVGKTTVTLGLASAAAQAGDRVLVVDLDPQGSSTWVLGYDPSADQASTADVLGPGHLPRNIWMRHGGLEVDVIRASRSLQDPEAGKPKRLR